MEGLGYSLEQALDFLGVTGEERRGCEELLASDPVRVLVPSRAAAR